MKRTAEKTLTQDNWQEEEGEGEEEGQEAGEFKQAAPEELAKRRIVKARRSANGATVPDAVAEKVEEVKPVANFSWTTPDKPAEEAKKGDESAAEKDAKENGLKSNDKNGEESGEEEKTEEKKPGEATKEDKESAKDGEKKDGGGSQDGEKKSLFNFSSGFSFGTSSAGSSKPFSFAGAGTGSGFSFGTTSAFSSGFTFGTGTKMESFTSVESQGWTSKQKKEDGEDGEDGEGGGEEDAQAEVAVKKSDAIVQLDLVETCTGEEDETCVFQVRAKLFTLMTHSKDKPSEGSESSSKEADSSAPSWTVMGIGDLKINVPKEGDTDKTKRPRIIMRRQKTFQLCLNTYLFENMVCDKAGPKEVRFTGMKIDSEKELATYLVRVKEEEDSDKLISLVHKHKSHGKE